MADDLNLELTAEPQEIIQEIAINITSGYREPIK